MYVTVQFGCCVTAGDTGGGEANGPLSTFLYVTAKYVLNFNLAFKSGQPR